MGQTQMDDKELLELAAKAAGIEYLQTIEGRPFEYFGGWLRLNHDGKKWAPLTDDGDALRLAVKLQMLIEINLGCVIAYAERKDGSVQDPEYVYFDKLETGREHGDRLAATRRAIVRAAAEIGKEL